MFIRAFWYLYERCCRIIGLPFFEKTGEQTSDEQYAAAGGKNQPPVFWETISDRLIEEASTREEESVF